MLLKINSSFTIYYFIRYHFGKWSENLKLLLKLLNLFQNLKSKMFQKKMADFKGKKSENYKD